MSYFQVNEMSSCDVYISPAIKRNIKAKEKELGRKCRKIWVYQNRLGECFMFANFCKNWDRLIVTLGHYEENIRKFIPSY
ncbi:MAG: hypothetical protein J7L15_01080 [Clostridiales bacterium]|nr:hypothetical protein [Clostridiales bacterium]